MTAALNQEARLHTLAAVAASTILGGDMLNPMGAGLLVILDITAQAGGTPSVTVTIEGKDPSSGKYYTILASAALASVATTVLRVYPGLVPAANLTVNDVLPKTWRVKAVVAGAGTVTATIGAVIQV